MIQILLFSGAVAAASALAFGTIEAGLVIGAMVAGALALVRWGFARD